MKPESKDKTFHSKFALTFLLSNCKAPGVTTALGDGEGRGGPGRRRIADCLPSLFGRAALLGRRFTAGGAVLPTSSSHGHLRTSDCWRHPEGHCHHRLFCLSDVNATP